MKLSELIAAVGDENIKVQSLDKSFTHANDSAKKGCCTITFQSELGLLSGGEYTALVIWIPKSKLPPT